MAGGSDGSQVGGQVAEGYWEELRGLSFPDHMAYFLLQALRAPLCQPQAPPMLWGFSPAHLSWKRLNGLDERGHGCRNGSLRKLQEVPQNPELFPVTKS